MGKPVDMGLCCSLEAFPSRETNQQALLRWELSANFSSTSKG
jgi:hypothetical protein